LWDPYIYPGFPVPNAAPVEIWDTSELPDNFEGDEEEEQGMMNSMVGIQRGG